MCSQISKASQAEPLYVYRKSVTHVESLYSTPKERLLSHVNFRKLNIYKRDLNLNLPFSNCILGLAYVTHKGQRSNIALL